MPAPKFATPRDFDAPTLGHRQGKFARIMLGAPFMPFQQYIADVGGELQLDPETGLWLPRYTTCLVTVQRQAGKSHMSMARNGERCFSNRRYKSWYTAQTGQDARDQFLKFYDENVCGSPLEALVKLKRGRGEEMLVFPNGSTMRPHPPTEEKLHGKQSDSNDIDEAWAFEQLEGRALTQAIGPTHLTRPGAQTWIWSAGGTANSTWLAELVAKGRSGEDPRMFFAEFGIPDDADAEDLQVIYDHHPAAGHTVTMSALESLRSEFGDDAPGWARAAGNRWTEIIGGAIRADDWKAMRWTQNIPDEARVGYGTARAADGSSVAIVAAAEVDGLIVCELLDELPTAYLAAEHVAAWAIDGPLAVNPNGPSAALAGELDSRKVRNLMPLSGQHASASVVNLLDSVPLRGIRFRPHPGFDNAVKVAGTRNTGDGGKDWARVAAGASIAPLEAAALAAWAVRHGPRRGGRQRLVTATS